MKRFSTLVLAFMICLFSFADKQEDYRHLFNALGIDDILLEDRNDTVLPYSGYNIHLMNVDTIPTFMGLDLFSNGVKEAVDRDILESVETALLAQVVNKEIDGNIDIEFLKGKLMDLKNISPSTPCNVSNTNSQTLSIEWDLENLNSVIITVPINYDIVKGGSRGEIESRLINRIKKSDTVDRVYVDVRYQDLIPHEENGYALLPGPSHINNDINRNIYFTSDSIPTPIWNPTYPVESISNLFLYPSDLYDMRKMELTVRKHEYGEKESFESDLNTFLAVCEQEGCTPYWGIESYDGTNLIGSLFLYNWKHGYEHVVKIECVPKDVICGYGMITGKASLFIPSNNIKSLFDEDE